MDFSVKLHIFNFKNEFRSLFQKKMCIQLEYNKYLNVKILSKKAALSTGITNITCKFYEKKAAVGPSIADITCNFFKRDGRSPNVIAGRSPAITKRGRKAPHI